MRTPSGVIIDTDHGPRLRFERQYPYPANEVWSALTTPERVARWLGELRPSGDTTRLVMGDGDGEYADLTIVACERPTRPGRLRLRVAALRGLAGRVPGR